MGRVFWRWTSGWPAGGHQELSPRFRGDPVLRERFMHEARAMAQLTHPHIAHIYSLGPPDEPPHFVMEFVEGAPLMDAARV